MKHKRTKRRTAPKYIRQYLKVTVPILLCTWLLCILGTIILIASVHKEYGEDYVNSSIQLYESMINRYNSEYSASIKGEETTEPISYAQYQKFIQSSIRYNGQATILCDDSEEDIVLVDASKEKLFTNVIWADSTKSAYLSCDTEMDAAYYEFMDFYKSFGSMLQITEMYVNWNTWEFIPKKMYVLSGEKETGEVSKTYETTLSPGEHFELLTDKDERIERLGFGTLLYGTWIGTSFKDKEKQTIYEFQAVALEELIEHYPEISDDAMSYTFYQKLLLQDSKIISSVPVSLFDETGQLRSYKMIQEHQYNVLDLCRSKIIICWCSLTMLALIFGTLWSYLRYDKLKNQWQQENYRRNLNNTMAHDLKSPLMEISGYAENLKEQIHPEKAEYYTEEILKTVNYMDGIVADMLDMERLVEPFYLNKEEFQLEDLLLELSKDYQDIMDRKHLLFTIIGNATMRADKKMIRRALDNLLNNAVKYTPKGGEIKAMLSVRSLSFINTGVSMSKELCEKAFEPFIKEDNARSSQVGSGIGLTITKQIFDAHEMICSIESKKNMVEVIVKWS